MTSPGCNMQSHVDAHFAATIAPDDERAMRAHIRTCEDCRGRYRRRLLLAKLDPQALSADVRIAQGLGLRRVRPATRLMLPVVGAAFAAAAAVLLLLRAPHSGDGFTARGGGQGADAHVEQMLRRSSLHVYRVPPKEEGSIPVPVVDTLRRDDELAFAYENADRKKYLMIFAVDDRGRVYWFYPGWANSSESPRAIAVTSEPGIHELPDAVVHHFEGSKLDIHSLLLDEPMNVRDVEQAVASARQVEGAPLSIDGGIDHVQHFRMVP